MLSISQIHFFYLETKQMEPVLCGFTKLSKLTGFDKCLAHVDKFISVLESTKESVILGIVW